MAPVTRPILVDEDFGNRHDDDDGDVDHDGKGDMDDSDGVMMMIMLNSKLYIILAFYVLILVHFKSNSNIQPLYN